MEADVKKTKIIITGVTGLTGKGVLFECLDHPAIEQVLLVTR
jgi:N-acetyl-gamma-glutamylphosphate reductase